MNYVQPFTYFLNARGGFGNGLLCAVCNFIPVVGPVVLLGYRAEVADELVRDRRLRRHPVFDFNRFGDYLSRGVWPFVYQLLMVIAAGGLGLAAVMAGVLAAGVADLPPVGLAVGVLLIVLVVLGLPAVLWPMELHAQLTGRFAPVEAAGFAYRFLGRVWGQVLVSLLAFTAGSLVVVVCGLLVCFVGVYLAAVVQMMAQQHLMTQLYLLYLDDGGDPIDELDDEDDRPRRRRDDD
jgi:hypothetical protein